MAPTTSCTPSPRCYYQPVGGKRTHVPGVAPVTQRAGGLPQLASLAPQRRIEVGGRLGGRGPNNRRLDRRPNDGRLYGGRLNNGRLDRRLYDRRLYDRGLYDGGLYDGGLVAPAVQRERVVVWVDRVTGISASSARVRPTSRSSSGATISGSPGGSQAARSLPHVYQKLSALGAVSLGQGSPPNELSHTGTTQAALSRHSDATTLHRARGARGI